MLTNPIYPIYMFKEHLQLNNLRKIQPKQIIFDICV